MKITRIKIKIDTSLFGQNFPRVWNTSATHPACIVFVHIREYTDKRVTELEGISVLELVRISRIHFSTKISPVSNGFF